MNDWGRLTRDLKFRFDEAPDDPGSFAWPNEMKHPPAFWADLASRGSVRAFKNEVPSAQALKTLAALALSAPTKSDLQQRDIIIVRSEETLARLKTLLASQDWISGAPSLIVFCANHRRQRMLHQLRNHEFANDHLDAFFNASVDAAIVLAAFVLVAEAAGYGVCPISAIRNAATEASEVLGLPDHVFPIAALAIGVPAERPEPSLRLPLAATVHENHYNDDAASAQIESYDRRRAGLQPYAKQREVDTFGVAARYTWSEDKARQYHLPERSGFGAFIRDKGFNLD